MATLQKIRNRGPVIAIVIGIALVAFLLGDISKIFSSNEQNIAEINGKSVSLMDYQISYNNYEQGFKMLTGETSISDANKKYVKSQVWNKIVQDYALSSTYKELGIDVSGMELAKIISGENIQTGLDPLTKQVFSDQKGNFNVQAAVNFFSNSSETKEGSRVAKFLEEEMKNNRKYTKYMALISKGINVTNLEAKNLYKERTEIVDFDYAVKKYNTVPDSSINVSDAELENYYDEHKAEYEQKHTRDIAYVTFNILPSEEDRKVTREELEYYKKEFKEISVDSTNEDIINYVNANSQVKFLYPHVSFDELKDSSLFYANSNEVFGPTLENGSYVMKRVFDRTSIPDSIEVRHILIQPDAKKIADMKRAKEVADSLLSLIKKGADFAKIAKENSIYKQSAEKGGDLGMLAEASFLNQFGPEFSDECFKSKKGELKIVETKYGIHIAEIIGMSKGSNEKIRLALLSQEVRPGNTTVSAYFAKARDFSSNSDNSIDKFNELVEKEGYTKRIANNIAPETEVIAGIENPSSIINWIFNDDTEKESVSSAFQDGDMFIVGIVTEVREEGIAPLNQIKDQITAKVVKQKKAEKFVSEMKGETNLVKTAKNISFSSSRLNDDGIEYNVIATAVYSEKDKISEPIIGENGVYVLKVSSKTGIDNIEEIDVSNDKNNAQRRYYFRVSREAFDAVKEAADVKDDRYKFM